MIIVVMLQPSWPWQGWRVSSSSRSHGLFRRALLATSRCLQRLRLFRRHSHWCRVSQKAIVRVVRFAQGAALLATRLLQLRGICESEHQKVEKQHRRPFNSFMFLCGALQRTHTHISVRARFWPSSRRGDSNCWRTAWHGTTECFEVEATGFL